jgi:hypothetical protein
MLLRPGDGMLFLVPLQQGTLRWQLGYTIHGASYRDRVENALAGDLGDRLSWLCEHVLSTNEGPPKMVWSDLFEAPQAVKSPAAPSR